MGKARAGSGKDKSKVKVVSKPNTKPGASFFKLDNIFDSRRKWNCPYRDHKLAASKTAHSKKQSANTEKKVIRVKWVLLLDSCSKLMIQQMPRMICENISPDYLFLMPMKPCL
jgi:hypothetical protein